MYVAHQLAQEWLEGLCSVHRTIDGHDKGMWCSVACKMHLATPVDGAVIERGYELSVKQSGVVRELIRHFTDTVQ